jgi:tyrosine-protein kinase Etk/Wzc
VTELMHTKPAELTPQWDAPAQREDEFDLHALLGTLADHKWFLLIGMGVLLLASVLYVAVAEPVYQASAMVQVERNTPTVPGQPQVAGSAIDAPASRAETEIPLLTSRSAMSAAVEALNLDIRSEPRRFPLIGEFMARRFTPDEPGDVAPAWFGLDRYGWGGEELQILKLEVPQSLINVPLVLVAGEDGHYSLMDGDGNLLVEGQVGQLSRGNGVAINIGMLRANPGTQFYVTHRSHMDAIASLEQNINAREHGEDSGIIDLTYVNSDPLLAARVLSQITESYVRQNIERNSAEAEKRLQFVNEQLPKVRKELERAQTALNEFQTREGTVDIELKTAALLNQTVAINSSLQQLRTQQPEIARRFTSAHPAAQALQQQIAQLEAEKAELAAKMSELPDIQQGLYRLSRDVEVSNRTYTNLLDEAQQLDIARASAIGNVRVIDEPAVNMTDPVWPKPVPVIAGTTLVGGLLLVAFVLMRHTLKRGVEDPEDIEQLGLPVYASVFLSAQERSSAPRRIRRHSAHPRLLALEAPADLAMEALRGLRTSLHFSRHELANNLLMIAGSSAGVGKTFVSSNLAVTVAQSGQRVLLIDADMRRGTLHEIMGTRWENGLSELISGQISLDDAIRQLQGTENLSFIPRGKVPPNPSELLMNPQFAAFLREVSASYDLVIIDTPPVLAVTDAAVIGQHVGTTLLVVRFGVNPQREVAYAKQRLEQNGVKVKGAIVNAVQRRSTSRDVYAYSYYESKPA